MFSKVERSGMDMVDLQRDGRLGELYLDSGDACPESVQD
jgi:hypothetical protein